MPLSLDDAGRALDRVLTFLHANPVERAQYIAAIKEAVGWMKPDRFEMVCVQMVAEMKQGRKPVPSQFVAVYNRLDDKYGWRKKDADTNRCRSCGGARMVMGQFQVEGSGEIIDAARPCPSCHPLKDAPLKPGLIPLETQDDYLMRTAKSIKSKASAALVLDLTEKFKVTLPDDVVLQLSETLATGTDDGKRDTVYEKALEQMTRPNSPLARATADDDAPFVAGGEA